VKSDRFRQNLIRYYSFYTGGFIAFVLLLAIAEALGLPKRWIGYCFLAATFFLYAAIGFLTRTRDEAEYDAVQRHGDGSRLDECGIVHRYGRHFIPVGL
jgi:hypothetical protein